MSIPVYTRAESTLTISMGRISASRRAHSLLPTAVGPASTMTGNGLEAAAPSASTQEELIELAQRQTRPGRTPVIALIGALGGLHLAKERVHLGKREASMGVNRRPAG